MEFKRHILWALSFLLMNSVVGFSQESALLFRQAEAALHDGLYEQAASILEPLPLSSLSKGERMKVVLLHAHVLFGQKKFAALGALLKKQHKSLKKEGLLGDSFYWKSRSEYAQGRAKSALNMLDTLPQESSPLYMTAHWLKARLLLELKEYSKAAKVYNLLVDEQISTSLNSSALLHWATLLISSDRWEEASLLLAQIESSGSEAEKTEARYWSARLLSEQGKWEEAETLLKDVTTAQTASPELLGQAWQTLADGYLAGGSVSNALLALKQGEELASDRSQVLALQVKQVTLNLQQKTYDEAEGLLRKLVAEHGENSDLGDLLLLLAEARLDVGGAEKAFKLFESYMDLFSDPEGRVRAMAGKAWAYTQLNDPVRAEEWFKKAVEMAKDYDRKRLYTLYYADALYAAKSFKLAREVYREYAQRYPGDLQQAQALFQSALCLMEQGLYPDAELELKRLADLYPGGDMAQRARLQLALLKERQTDYTGAIEMYDRYLALYTAGTFSAEVMLNKGIALYRLGEFGEALKHFKNVEGMDAEKNVKERALYLEGWATYLNQGAEEALPLFSSFIQKYPESLWAEHVLFWRGETYFNQQNFKEALSEYTHLIEVYPKGLLLEKALYWAGRSAMNLKEYVQAIQLFKRVVDDFPQSARRADALFWEGDALTALGEFDTAILVFDRLLKEFKDSYLVCSAWGRKGDCYFILADADPARYEQALAVYKELFEMGDICSRDLKLQALYKQGRVSEVLQRFEEALHLYEQTVYHFLEYRADLSRESVVSFSRAAFAAAELHEKKEHWRQAIALYKRVRDARVDASEEADQRIQKIRVEHLVIF